MHDISLVNAIIFNIQIPPTFCEQYMSRDMRFPTMLHFDMNRHLLSFETPNAVRSNLNSHRAIQATSKCSDQTVCMQAVWIQIRSGALSGLIWLQTVCKGYQQKTQADKQLIYPSRVNPEEIWARPWLTITYRRGGKEEETERMNE